jgi:hypothetical protein
MTKLDLQKELLEKVKPGMKPSDIKRQAKKQSKKLSFTPPMSTSKSDEGYESDEQKLTATPLPNSQKDLQAQITSLKNQLQLYKDFQQADLKIKEQYKQEITECKKTIAELKSQAKSTREPQPQATKTFLCSSCQQTKPNQELSRVFGDCSFCLTCSKKARKQAQQEKQPSPQPEEFTCHSCQQTYQTTPNKMKLDSTLQTYLICSPCRPTLKEFNEADLITDDLWVKYPYSSASEILEKEFNIKKGEAW